MVLPFAEDHDVSARAAEQVGGLGIGVDGGLPVGGQERRQSFFVEMVSVLVGDYDGVEIAKLLEVGGERPWVHEDPRVGELDEEAGMAEMGDAHGDNVPIRNP